LQPADFLLSQSEYTIKCQRLKTAVCSKSENLQQKQPLHNGCFFFGKKNHSTEWKTKMRQIADERRPQ